MPRAAHDQSLIDVLKGIVGDEHVLHTPEDMLVFEFDGSIDRRLPQAVVLPSTAEEVSRVVRLAHDHGVPLVPRGAGTGLSGGAVAIEGGILLVTTRMNRILEVDPVNRCAVVEPGVINLHVSQRVAEYGLMYVPDPSSQKTCTIGGNVAENSGGPHCLAYGVTTNHVLGLEVVLPDGEIVRLGGFEPGRPGYDLLGLFIGSEGTLGVATKIMVKLTPEPEAVKTLVAPFKDIDDASRAVSEIIARGVIPAALEMMDRMTIEAVGPIVRAEYPPDAGAVLLIEVDGPREAVDADAASVEAICVELGAQEIRSAEDPKRRERLWAARKGALGALGRLSPNYYILDGVVPRVPASPKSCASSTISATGTASASPTSSTPATATSTPTSSSTNASRARPSASSTQARRSCASASTWAAASPASTASASKRRASCASSSPTRTCTPWRK